MPVRKVAEILDDVPGLASLAVVAQRTAELQRVYLEAVPAELRRTSRVGWTRPGILFVAAANGAVAAKLRQLAPRILDRFSRAGLEFNSMRVEVQVGARVDATVYAANAKALPPHAVEAIRRVADQLADSPLKTALTRLGRRHQSTRSKT